jgi:hypothetical protein
MSNRAPRNRTIELEEDLIHFGGSELGYEQQEHLEYPPWKPHSEEHVQEVGEQTGPIY